MNDIRSVLINVKDSSKKKSDESKKDKDTDKKTATTKSGYASIVDKLAKNYTSQGSSPTKHTFWGKSHD